VNAFSLKVLPHVVESMMASLHDRTNMNHILAFLCVNKGKFSFPLYSFHRPLERFLLLCLINKENASDYFEFFCDLVHLLPLKNLAHRVQMWLQKLSSMLPTLLSILAEDDDLLLARHGFFFPSLITFSHILGDKCNFIDSLVDLLRNSFRSSNAILTLVLLEQIPEIIRLFPDPELGTLGNLLPILTAIARTDQIFPNALSSLIQAMRRTRIGLPGVPIQRQFIVHCAVGSITLPYMFPVFRYLTSATFQYRDIYLNLFFSFLADQKLAPFTALRDAAIGQAGEIGRSMRCVEARAGTGQLAAGDAAMVVPQFLSERVFSREELDMVCPVTYSVNSSSPCFHCSTQRTRSRCRRARSRMASSTRSRIVSTNS
jgi:hypothetical protein